MTSLTSSCVLPSVIYPGRDNTVVGVEVEAVSVRGVVDGNEIVV